MTRFQRRFFRVERLMKETFSPAESVCGTPKGKETAKRG